MKHCHISRQGSQRFWAGWGVLGRYCLGSHAAETFDQLGWLLWYYHLRYLLLIHSDSGPDKWLLQSRIFNSCAVSHSLAFQRITSLSLSLKLARHWLWRRRKAFAQWLILQLVQSYKGGKQRGYIDPDFGSFWLPAATLTIASSAAGCQHYCSKSQLWGSGSPPRIWEKEGFTRKGEGRRVEETVWNHLLSDFLEVTP